MTTETYDPQSTDEIILCVCCNAQMDASDDFCEVCHTPAEITRSIAKRNVCPHFISVVGPSNAGKTVYLGLLLDVLCGGARFLKGVPNGAFSLRLQEQVVAALEDRRFPEKTPNESDLWKWLHCVVTDSSKRKVKQVDFVAPDFAGEAIAMELEHPGTYPAVSHIVERTAAFLLLCDSIEVRDNGAREDLFAMKLGSYISQQQGLSHLDKSQDLTPAVAVVFTKSDTCPEAEANPKRFMENNMPRFTDYCEQNFPRHEVFSASVVGSSVLMSNSSGAMSRLPLHIQPRGVIEPLHWAIQNS
ncbi:TRAFAC clade GTPase domain-containing protein [Roseiconus lacunae]|uniref:Double-GTPase 2 domain-containing protein n=1 Tax=Roseiconus lacunae TaxID=2605694 RepID=A0ABT7PLT6_9BACT|nr:hypothetical protein [Roseiconus lacunae]MCD0458110.1 hypothetical protein [Roseiconus lacunae]MDM4017450.1 hypothetical protein [Roseiconus lacunae]WRQ53699.1 hypothetical protein U8335_14495 [Stieleria sp. HD01]